MSSVTCAFTQVATALRAGSIGNSEKWSNLSNGLVSDNSRVTFSHMFNGPISGYTKWLVFTGLASSVPAGATINGIKLDGERRCSTGSANVVRDSAVQLWTGVATGNSKAVTGTPYTTTDATVTYGASGDTWGLTLIGANLGSSFGVAVSCYLDQGFDNSDMPEVDFLGNVTIYYTESSPGSGAKPLERVKAQIT